MALVSHSHVSTCCSSLVSCAHDPLQVVEDLRRTLAQELDFRQEAANSRALADATVDNPSVAVPRVHDELSNQRVIVMEWVSGAKVRPATVAQACGSPLHKSCSCTEPGEVMPARAKKWLPLLHACGGLRHQCCGAVCICRVV